MKYFFSIALILLIVGCNKDYVSQYTATLTNNTQHSIIILCYKGGIVYPSDTIKLHANTSLEIANGFIRGDINVPGFTSQYFGGPNDSNIVIFDGIHKISHYANTPVNLASKYYLNSSIRNINNPKSYRFVSTPTDHAHKNDHYYEFIEQDYLDAL